MGVFERKQQPKQVRAYLQIRVSAKTVALLEDCQKMLSAPDPSSVMEKAIVELWEKLRGGEKE